MIDSLMGGMLRVDCYSEQNTASGWHTSQCLTFCTVFSQGAKHFPSLLNLISVSYFVFFIIQELEIVVSAEGQRWKPYWERKCFEQFIRSVGQDDETQLHNVAIFIDYFLNIEAPLFYL